MDAKKKRIKELTELLITYCEAYYKYDNPLVSDKEYDKLYDELEALEKETGFILNNSPTQKVQGEVLEGLTKVTHTEPMLSANKTKIIEDIEDFVGEQEVVMSYKADGLTIVCKYDNGQFIQAITRGSGIEGEDITHTMKFCKNLPKTISYTDYLEIRGEGVISWKNFEKINNTLEKKYAHPRNLAAGTVRQLDASVARERDIEFLAFNIVNTEDLNLYFKTTQLNWLEQQGFTTVGWEKCSKVGVKRCVEKLNRENYAYPTDGWIVEYSDINYGKSLGSTSHHPNNIMALKPENETVETKFIGIDYKTSRNGIVSLTAIFEPCEIDGTIVERASVHNVDIFEGLELGEGDTISVYKANLIIPQIEDNLTRSGTYKLTKTCPTCGERLKIETLDKSRVLKCNNPNCQGQRLGKFVQMVNKDGFNIVGLSEATLEALIDNKLLNILKDVFYLKEHKESIKKLPGFGEKSAQKLIDAIEKSRSIKMENFITALGIPNIGKSAAKTISNYFGGNYYRFLDSLENNFDFTVLEDFGLTMSNNLHNWYRAKNRLDDKLDREVIFIKPPKITKEVTTEESIFSGKTIVISGSFKCGSRDEIQAKVEALGGKFTGSVSKKTNILLAGEKCGSKLTKAQELGTTIMTEEELIKYIN